jgi:hypothetical protein
MITSVATLLRDLMVKESAALAREPITHGPTIGSMYEGLTREILDRAIPLSLDLRIVDGFIDAVSPDLSPQMDAMLVTGEGRQIPHTEHFVWPIRDVLAVLEVKKNLYGADLEDGFRKMRTVMHMQTALMEKDRSEKTYNLHAAFQAFARLTGHYPRSWKEASELPDELSFIFHTLVTEQLAPVRVIFGYEGYADEFSLRKGLADFLQANLGTPAGFGVGSLPNLIVCRQNSLLKMNGQPYISPQIEGWWQAIVSNAENPLRLLIELIWTKLSNRFSTQFPMDDSLQMERLASLLSTRLAKRGAVVGWEYREDGFDRQKLSGTVSTTWSPDQTSEDEWVVLMQVANKGELDVQDAGFRNYAREEGFDADALIAALVERRSLAWSDDRHVRLISTDTLFTAFMPDGRTIATSEADMLGMWFAKEMAEKGTKKP